MNWKRHRMSERLRYSVTFSGICWIHSRQDSELCARSPQRRWINGIASGTLRHSKADSIVSFGWIRYQRTRLLGFLQIIKRRTDKLGFKARINFFRSLKAE